MKFSYVLPDPGSYGTWDEFAADVHYLKQLGYDAMELQIADPAELEEKALREVLSRSDFELIAFQTGTTYLTKGNCLSSPDKAVRERTKELLKRFVDLAQRFSSIMVFGSLQGRRADESDYQKGLSRILEAMEIVGRYATANGVTIAYEPVNHLETAYHNTIASVADLVRKFNLPGIRLMIDTFHMNIEEVSMTDGLEAVKDILVHVHLSETNRNVLGLGHWDTQAFLKKLGAIGYEGYCSIGVYNSRLPRRDCMRKCLEAVGTLTREHKNG
jgi:D-psicose/D-tagatose/L-ribulose 3-epimerase